MTPSPDDVPQPTLPERERRGSSLYVVGIGASAGGLEALEQFFDHVPPDSGMAFVVVQHLSPDFKSLMDEILARRTKLPIRSVEDGVHVEPNNIYLIPPKKQMIIAAGQLLLREKERHHDLSLPIDVFFRSLAQDCAERGIAVVLSGGGSDGSRGILAVHEAGGLVLVQSGESAQFDGMPKTARDSGVAKHVLRPHEMPAVIVQHVRRASGLSSEPIEREPGGMAAVYRMLEKEFGIDFTHYKPSTVTRRIERRLALSRVDDIDEYAARLRAERSELNVLYRDLLIGVTRFFRNAEAFRILEEQVLPELLASREPGAPVRMWVAGCATGEEVYSIAIVLHELMQRMGERSVKIFATDVHNASIETATRGLYDAQTLESVSPERMERYFVQRGQHYQIAPEIRQMAVFATHNVIKDAPFTRVDLVSCRNMLIYLQPPVQQKVLNLFQFALNRGGTLFLGPSESPGTAIGDFDTIDKRWRIYRKRGDGASREALLRGSTTRPLPASAASLPRANRPPPPPLLATYDAVLERFMPPSLLVNEQGELVHVFGSANRFVRVRGGRQTLELLNMVHSDLRAVLFGALGRTLRQAEPIVFSGVRVSDEDDELYKVTLQRIEARGAAAANVLISFEPIKTDAVGPKERQRERGLDLVHASREQVASLEAELTYTKENLQAATEELETSNEELQAANEELLASNEELQSTNEELQSVNEELYSVNAEYQRKIADLTELGNDMENLLSSTDVGTIFLDRQLRVRKFTPQIADVFNLLPQDIGRPIAAFSHNVEHPRLLEDLQRVLESGVPVECEVKHHGQDHSSFLRILPYRAKGTIDGVVLTMIDVSGLRAAEDALFHERYLLNSLLATVPDAIYFKDARGRFIRANREMAKRLGLSDAREAVGKTGFELPGHEVALAVHQQDELVLKSGQVQYYSLEARAGATGEMEWDLVTRLPLRDSADNVVGIIGIFRNVTEQKRAELAIEEAVRRRDQFLAMLSHELRNPLGAIVAATALLKGGRADASKREKLSRILERQSQHMARLLDDLLEVSRVTQDRIELRKRPVDLAKVTREAVEAVRSTMEERGLSFSTKFDGEPLFVEGDPARLQQIQANLLHNAAKYTPRGGHVELELKRAGEQAVICVRDDGMGIPQTILNNVFDLFVQNKRTLDRSDGGLGVGLTLVRGLVHKHGGTVHAHSEGEGKGSEFQVSLPCIDPPVEELPARALPVSELSHRKLNVVVIEDNADSRGLLCELLEFAGYNCHTAEDGVSGLELLDELNPDLALVDIGLPGIDGLELARRVRASPRLGQMLLVALTGYGQREDTERVRKAGFDHHLVKPVDPAMLIRLLGELSASRASGSAT